MRLILFPLTWKQYKSAQQMQVIQPQIKELQKKYKSDRGKLQEETMKLYSEHRVNPFASCLPLILQLPVFISLYAAIKGLGPLSARPRTRRRSRPSTRRPSCGSRTSAYPDPYYILLILYVVSQMISTELMVATQSDQTQKWIMRAMPIMFVLFLFRFPAGLFVYWVTTNVWTIGQQLVIRRTMPKPEELAAKAKAKPKKRSRFMEAMMASQGEAMKQRDEKIAKKSGQGRRRGQAGHGGGGQEAGARRQEAAARQGQAQGAAPGRQARPDRRGQAQERLRRPAGQAEAGEPAAEAQARGQPAGEPSGGGSAPGGDGGATTSAGGPAED